MNRLTPTDLPTAASTTFIAYAAPVRVADPQGGGEPLTIRPQVLVKYFPEIKVLGLKEGGRNGNASDLLTVEFDPTSVAIGEGRTLTQSIRAHMDSSDPTIAILRKAFENGGTIAIGIETQRKAKNSATKEPINPLTPIHALRGASNPDGSGDNTVMMGPSGQNTTNRLVFVNGQATKHLQSDPAEWKALTNNKAGDLPPAGWRYYAPGDDWREYGAVVPAEGPSAPAPAPGAPSLATPASEGLASLLENTIRRVLADIDGEQGRPTAPRGKWREGKPYDARTSDGRINLGGYAVSAYRGVFTWAAGHIEKTTQKPAPMDDAWTLATAAMEIADEVQVLAYALLVGHQEPDALIAAALPDRTIGSHRDAEQWVQWVIDNTHCPDDLTIITDKEWRAAVIRDAAQNFAEAGRRTGDALTAKSPQTGPVPVATAEGPSPKVITAYLQTITKAWDNAQTLRNLGNTGNDSGYLALSVSRQDGEGAPVLSFPAVEGESAGPLGALIAARVSELDADSDDGPAPAAPSAQEHQPYTPALTDAIHAAQTATTIDALRSVRDHAHSVGIIDAPVWASATQGGVEIGQPGQDGYAPRPFSAVIDRLRATIAQAAPAATPQVQAQEPATETTVAPEQGDTAAQAQALVARADKAIANGATPEALDAFIEEAKSTGLADILVTIRGRQGALGSYLASRRAKVVRSTAVAQG